MCWMVFGEPIPGNAPKVKGTRGEQSKNKTVKGDNILYSYTLLFTTFAIA